MPLLLALISVPAIEIAGVILVGGMIGPWPTLALVMLGSAAGVLILRRQGLVLLGRAERAIGSGDVRFERLLDRVCLVLAGMLFLIPGLVSDLVAILLLIRPVRRLIGGWLVGVIRRHADMQVVLNGRSMDFGPKDFGPTDFGPKDGGSRAAGPDKGSEPPPPEPALPAEEPVDAPRLSDSRWRPSRSRFRSD